MVATLRDMVIGDGHPIILMAGPCVVESEEWPRSSWMTRRAAPPSSRPLQSGPPGSFPATAAA